MPEKLTPVQEQLQQEIHAQVKRESITRAVGGAALGAAVTIGLFELARHGVDLQNNVLCAIFTSLESGASAQATISLLHSQSQLHTIGRLREILYTDRLRREGEEAISDVVVPSEPEHR